MRFAMVNYKIYFSLWSISLIVSQIVNLIFVQPSFAQDEAYKINLSSSIYNVVIEPEDALKDRVIFWGEAKGNFSQAIRFAMAAPEGVKVRLQTKSIGPKANIEQLANNNTGWVNLPLRDTRGRNRAEIELRTPTGLAIPSVASSQGSNHFSALPTLSTSYSTNSSSKSDNEYDAGEIEQVCKFLKGDSLKVFVDAVNKAQGTNLTVAQYCKQEEESYGRILPEEGEIPADYDVDSDYYDDEIDPFAGGNIPANYASSGLYRAVLSKNACAPRRRYLVRMILDSSQLDPAIREGGYLAIFSLHAIQYNGSRASALKPESDGKFFGKPIVIMSALLNSSYEGASRVRVQRFKRGRVRTYYTTTDVDLIFHNNKIFARAPVSGALRGGRANFEYQSGNSTYSVCFRAVSTRQNILGYQGPSN